MCATAIRRYPHFPFARTISEPLRIATTDDVFGQHSELGQLQSLN